MAKMATRQAYGKALAELIVKNKNVVVLDADLTKSTMTNEAKAACPERHFNMGIAEGNMMAVGAGLAASGKIVYASSFAMFASGRAFEQIRNSICYPRLNVKICATHAGISVGEDGASHQAIEDMAIMRAIPNMKVFQPCDSIETKAIINAIAEIPGPCYVRMGRAAVEDVHDENYQFVMGKGEVLRKGKEIALLATGLEVQESLKAAELLKEDGYDVTVANFSSIKPIDEELIVSLAKSHKYLISVEEHNVIGGLGSAVAEVLVKKYPHALQMIGMQDVFGESGKSSDVLEKYGLTAGKIAEQVRKIVK